MASLANAMALTDPAGLRYAGSVAWNLVENGGGALVKTGALAALPSVLGLALVLFLVAGCRVEVLHDISESEANLVLAALQGQGISADKRRVTEGSKATYTVSVRRSDAPEAWRVLRRKNLPRPQEKGIGEVFGNVGLVPTGIQERALLRHALSGEIARTLNGVDGVQQARVHIVLPRRDALAPPDTPQREPRAAVLLKVVGTPPLTDDDIRRLVAGSVEGLKPENVNVVVSRGASRTTAMDGQAVAANVGPFRVAAVSRIPLAVTFVAGIVSLVALVLVSLLLLRRNRALSAALTTARAAPRQAGRVDSSLSLIEHSLGRRAPRDRTRGA